MKILIVEDERPIARYIERLCRELIGEPIKSTHLCFTLAQAQLFLVENPVDLCLLDLNLNGNDGYDLLKLTLAKAFHTIIISANVDRAIEAFGYEVVDFIPKPFTDDRLRQAFDRYFTRLKQKQITTPCLSVRKGSRNVLVQLDNIIYFKAAGIYVDAHLRNGQIEILGQTMDYLENILPARFVRIHRSYLVDVDQINAFGHAGGGNYQITTKTGEKLPVSRQKYKELIDFFNPNQAHSKYKLFE